MTFGEKLTEARTKCNLTQEQLAEKLFVTRQAVSRWENGKTQPDIQTLGRLCNVLEVAPDYFIEVDRREVDYNTLPKSRKTELYYSFFKEYKSTAIIFGLLHFLTSVALDGLVAVITLAILDSIHGTFKISAHLWINIALGAALMFAATLIYCKVRSHLYNNWLAQSGVVRTKKFMYYN